MFVLRSKISNWNNYKSHAKPTSVQSLILNVKIFLVLPVVKCNIDTDQNIFNSLNIKTFVNQQILKTGLEIFFLSVLQVLISLQLTLAKPQLS